MRYSRRRGASRDRYGSARAQISRPKTFARVGNEGTEIVKRDGPRLQARLSLLDRLLLSREGAPGEFALIERGPGAQAPQAAYRRSGERKIDRSRRGACHVRRF